MEPIVPRSWTIGEGIVELGVSANFGKEERRCEDCDPGHGAYGLSDLHANLIFEEFWVFKSRFVEDEDVGEGGDNEID